MKFEGGLRTKGLFNKGSQPNKPLVSIVTPCLNSEKYLEQTIKNVIGQTYDNIEYIIIDGGSKDGTLDIIRKYEDKIAYWVSEPDRGLYDAMNKGIAFSTGNLIGIINSDDWYQPETVEIVVKEYLENKNVGVFYGDLMFVEKGGNLLKNEGNLEALKDSMSIGHPTCFVLKRIYDNWKFDLNFKICADYDFLLKLYLSGIKFHYLNKVLVYCRLGGISSSSRFHSERLRENYIIRKKYFGIFRAIHLLFTDNINHFIKRPLVHILFKNNLNHPILQFYRKWIKGHGTSASL